MQASLLLLVSLTPYFLFQWAGYRMWCLPEPAASSWCSASIPHLYSHLQHTRWGVGFLSFYEFKQLPNILLAVPATVECPHLGPFSTPSRGD